MNTGPSSRNLASVWTLVVLLAAAGSPTGAHAQPAGFEPRLTPVPANVPAPSAPSSPTPATKPPDGQETPAGPPALPIDEAVLSKDTLAVPEVGMTVRVPLEARAERSTLAGVASVQVVAKDDRWQIRITTPRTSNASVTVREAMDKAILDTARRTGMIRDSKGTDIASDAMILEPSGGGSRVVRLAGAQGASALGERAVLSYPDGSRPGARSVQAIAFFKPTPTQFVVIELVCAQEAWASAKPAFDALVASTTFANLESQQSERQKVVAAGKALLSGLSETDYVAAMPEEGKGAPQWFRLSRPAPTGAESDAQELGYRGVRFWRGRLSDVGASVTSENANAEGYLVEIVARLIQPLGAGEKGYTLIDTKATYFLSLDREDEAWVASTSLRDSRLSKGRVLTETGARHGRSLSVQISESGQKTISLAPTVPPEGYLSQVESHLLPRLLIKSGVAGEAPMDFGFYAYRSDSQSVSLRRDRVARDPSQANAWTITTTFREGEPPQTSVFRDDADLVRTRLSDDRTWTPTTLEALMKLWEAKGLPTKGP